MYEALWQFGALQAGTSGAESSATAFMHMVYPTESSIISAAMLLQAYPQLTIAIYIITFQGARRTARRLHTSAVVGFIDAVVEPVIPLCSKPEAMSGRRTSCDRARSSSNKNSCSHASAIPPMAPRGE